MRLGITLHETYSLVLTVLVLLAAFGTSYCQWAIRKATAPEQIERIRVVNSRVKMGWWLIIIFTLAFWTPGITAAKSSTNSEVECEMITRLE